MKQLTDILYKVNLIEISGSTDLTVTGLAFDSRKVKQGFVFIAIKGLNYDGHDFIDSAVMAGAVVVVCENIIKQKPEGVVFIQVKDSEEALALMASNYYDNPSEKIKLVGITGTNGKTTTATLLYELMERLGYKAGLLSTVKNKIHQNTIEAKYTTPDAIEVNSLLSMMVDAGCEYCFMEVSSHAVVQKRIFGLTFCGGVFTNITHDHLDYHKTFAEYLAAKGSFFNMLPSSSFAIINIDDKNGHIMVQNSKAIKKTYAIKTLAHFKAKIVENRISGLHLNIDGVDAWFKLIGEFNAYNLLAIYATAVMLGITKEEVLQTLSNLNAVEGRFQIVESKNNITAIIDYAHTPDALENVLRTINSMLLPENNLITVVGCGGDRDAAKRPIMASLAAKMSNKAVFTSDNPRTEDPLVILEQMMNGVKQADSLNVMQIVNRKEAIKTAIALAKPKDVILVAGKGHENYQEINGVRHHFDDREVIQEFFNLIQ